MPRYWLRLVVVGLVASLAFATSAHAEWAWVLWGEDTKSLISFRAANAKMPGRYESPQEFRSWYILGSTPTKAACESQSEWKIGDMLKSWHKERDEAKSGEHTGESASNTISRRSKYVDKDKNTSATYQNIRYLCLPDTVDPRGPKAK